MQGKYLQPTVKLGRIPNAVKATLDDGLLLDYDGELMPWENYADDFNRSFHPDRDFSDVNEEGETL